MTLNRKSLCHSSSLLFWACLAIVWLGTLGQRALITPDEGRYATLSLGMLHSGDWITPRLNNLLYFEKPAMQYWAGAIAFKLFGVNEFAARFWPGLTGLLTVALVGLTGRKLWSPVAGRNAALVAAGCAWIVGNSHFLTLDAGVTFFLTAALSGFLLAQRDGADARQRLFWNLFMWAAMAGATLSKGLIGILIPGATLALYSLLARDIRPWTRMNWLPGLALFLVLSVPWFVLVSQQNPGFARFFFIHEHFQRFLTTEHRRTGPVWYFVPLLLVGFLPWTTLLPATLRAGWQREPGQFQPRRLLLAWSLFVFVFFSVSGSKLPSYILPMFPALALLLGRELETMAAPRLARHLIAPALLWLAVLAVLPFHARFASAETPPAALHALAVGLGIAAILFLLCAWFAWRALRRGEQGLALAAWALGGFLAVTAGALGHNTFGQLKSSKAVAQAAAPLLAPATPVFSVAMYDQTLPFYLRRPVTLVAYSDEFAFGQAAEPDKSLPDIASFTRRWRELPAAAAMMGPGTFATLSQEGLPMRVVYRDARRLFVIKPTQPANGAN